MIFFQLKGIGNFTATIFLSLICLTVISGQVKKTSDVVLSEVAAAVAAGNVGEAKKNLQVVLRSEPRNVTAQTLAGIIAERENDFFKAEKHFALAAKIAPQSADARNNYGAILQRLNRFTAAAAEFEAALKLNPKQRSALVNLAQIRYAEKRLVEARQFFEKAQAIEFDVEVARALIVIALDLKETARAAADYLRYAEFAEQSERLSAASRSELGAALLEGGLAKEAAAELTAAIALDSAQVETLILLSRAFLRQDNVKSAGKTLEAAIAGGSDDARLYAALADVYQAGGFLENAIPAMRLATEKDKSNESYRVRYGLLLNDTSAPAAAVIRLTEASQEFPRSARILVALGIAQQAAGNSVDAQKSFERALQLDENSVAALAYLATIAAEKALYSEAAALYQRALGVDEKNAVLHYLLADTLLKIATGDENVVEKHLKRALEINEELSLAHLALGRLYIRGARWQDAALAFEKAVRYEPKLAEAHYQYGRVLARLKRTEESRAALTEFKRLSDLQAAQRETTRKDLVRRLANTKF